MQFSYDAKTADGQTISGTVEAADERAAAGQIRALGHFPMRVRPARGAGPSTSPPPSQNGYGQPPAGYPPPTAYEPSHMQGGYQGATAVAPPPTYPQAPAVPGQTEVTAYPPQGIPTAADGLTATPQTQAWYQAPPTSGRREDPLAWLWNRLFKPLFPGVTPFQLSATYRQFGALVGAGVPLQTTIDTISAEAATPEMRKAIERMRPVISAGGPISQGMSLTPWIFPSSHRAMVIPGEVVGRLDIVFNRLADMVETEHRLRLKLQQEMVRPLLSLGAMFLLPPVFYLVLGMWKEYLFQALLPFLLTFVAIVGVWAATRLMAQARLLWDTFVAGLPSVGNIIRMLTIARFCRMLGMLYSGGVSVPASINYAADACGNVYLSWMMRKVAGYVEAGYQLVDGFTAVRVFPPMVISMMGTGEMTGKVDSMMQKVAEYYEAEADLAMHKSVQVFSTIVLIIIGIRVLMILIKFYTGYFSHLLSDQGILI